MWQGKTKPKISIIYRVKIASPLARIGTYENWAWECLNWSQSNNLLVPSGDFSVIPNKNVNKWASVLKTVSVWEILNLIVSMHIVPERYQVGFGKEYITCCQWEKGGLGSNGIWMQKTLPRAGLYLWCQWNHFSWQQKKLVTLAKDRCTWRKLVIACSAAKGWWWWCQWNNSFTFLQICKWSCQTALGGSEALCLYKLPQPRSVLVSIT